MVFDTRAMFRVDPSSVVINIRDLFSVGNGFIELFRSEQIRDVNLSKQSVIFERQLKLFNPMHNFRYVYTSFIHKMIKLE